MRGLVFAFARQTIASSKKTGTWQWTTSKEHPGIAVLQSLTGMEASAQQNMLASASDPCFKITLNWRLTLCSQSNECSNNLMMNSLPSPAKTAAQMEPPAYLASFLTVV